MFVFLRNFDITFYFAITVSRLVLVAKVVKMWRSYFRNGIIWKLYDMWLVLLLPLYWNLTLFLFDVGHRKWREKNWRRKKKERKILLDYSSSVFLERIIIRDRYAQQLTAHFCLVIFILVCLLTCEWVLVFGTGGCWWSQQVMVPPKLRRITPKVIHIRRFSLSFPFISRTNYVNRFIHWIISIEAARNSFGSTTTIVDYHPPAARASSYWLQDGSIELRILCWWKYRLARM